MLNFKGWSKRHKFFVSTGSVFLVFFVLIILTVKTLSSPAVGTITPPSGMKVTVKTEVKKAGTYSGKYISFTIPSNFTLLKSQTDSGFLEVVKLNSNDHSGKLVSIGVVKELVSNDSGVNFRKGHPDIYKQTTDSQGNLVFTKNQNGSEYTAFIPHNGLVTSVALTSTFTKDLSVDYKAITKNWQWK